jgi:NADH-quinone oxidoreductase subunit A
MKSRRLFVLWNGQTKLAGANLIDDAAMLRIHAKLQGLFTVRVEWKQVQKTVGAAMKDTAPQIDRGIDERLRGSALLRLDMEGVAGDCYVGVVAKWHVDVRPDPRAGWRKPRRNLSAVIDRVAAKSYYSNLPMTDSGLHTYAPLLLHLLIATGLAGALTAVSVLVGWRRPSRAKQQAYECGMEPTGDAREPFSVKFYLVAMVFILFDVEAIFLYPWAYIFRSLRWYGFVEMMIYIVVLLVGYLYLWKKGALDWHK